MSDGLGRWLRGAREARQVTLDQASEELRIRRRYLQALEVGDYVAFPGEIQARGFLRNYARYLGLPVDEALSRYDAEIHGHPVQPRTATTNARGEPLPDRPAVFAPPPTLEEEAASLTSPIPSWLFVAMAGALAFFVLVALVSFLWLRFAGPAAPTPSPASTPQVAATTVAATPAQTALPNQTFVPATDGRVHIRLVATEHEWISVSADANVIYQGVTTVGQVIEASAADMLVVKTGNGGAFHFYINGTDWGMLGEQGQIVKRGWSPSGEVNLETP